MIFKKPNLNLNFRFLKNKNQNLRFLFWFRFCKSLGFPPIPSSSRSPTHHLNSWTTDFNINSLFISYDLIQIDNFIRTKLITHRSFSKTTYFSQLNNHTKRNIIHSTNIKSVKIIWKYMIIKLKRGLTLRVNRWQSIPKAMTNS